MAHLSISEPLRRGPGPPWATSGPPPGPFEDGDDEYLAGGPDDLGDLILDMRDGGAWAEGLMDCGDGAAGHASQPPAADPMQTLLALSRRQQAQDLEQQAQAAPAVRAALAHPGQPPRGVLMHPGAAMVPVGGGGPLSCAAGLECGAGSQWPPAQQPAGPLPFFGAPAGGPAGGAPPLPWFVNMPQPVHPAPPPPLNFYPPDAGAQLAPGQLTAVQPQGEGHASGSGSVGFSDGTTLRMRSSLDSGSGSTLPSAGWPRRVAPATVPLGGMLWSGEFEESRDAPSDSSDVEDGGGDRMERQHSLAQVVPDAGMFMAGASLPFLCGYYGSQAALTARLARHASLERFRLKKARRALAGGGKKIRYVARKVNADKRIRVKGRFVKKGDEAAAILAIETQVATEAAA